jgi:two-component system response regulator
MHPRSASDRRDGKRSKMLKGGIIAFSARHATIPCVLRDLSEGGARLQVAQSSAVPDTFELIVELDGLEVPCEVVWRKVTEIGVAFTQAPCKVAPKRVQIVGQTGPVGRSTLRRFGSAAPPRAMPASVAPVETLVAPALPPVFPARTDEGLAAPAPVTTTPSAIPAEPRSRSRQRPIPILIAEDDPDDRLMMREAFEGSSLPHIIDFVENGEELLKYVRGDLPYTGRPMPGLILLDLNMPRMDGRTALMHLKTHGTYRRIPVIVLTTSNAEEDIHRTYELGVTAFVPKPSTQDGLQDLIESLSGFWTRFVSLPAA